MLGGRSGQKASQPRKPFCCLRTWRSENVSLTPSALFDALFLLSLSPSFARGEILLSHSKVSFSLSFLAAAFVWLGCTCCQTKKTVISAVCWQQLLLIFVRHLAQRGAEDDCCLLFLASGARPSAFIARKRRTKETLPTVRRANQLFKNVHGRPHFRHRRTMGTPLSSWKLEPSFPRPPLPQDCGIVLTRAFRNGEEKVTFLFHKLFIYFSVA